MWNPNKQNYRDLVPVFSFILLAGISYADYVSRDKVEFFIFYFPLIILSAWYSKPMWPTLLVVLLSCVSWTLDYAHSGGSAASVWIFLWNVGVHGLAFVFVGAISLILKKKHMDLSSIKEELHFMLEREKTVSRFDPLTGVLNRRAFEERLSSERKRSTRYNHPLSFLYIDIDRFKEINDQFGHKRGDEVLKNVASAIRKATRDVDSPARLGGDEFGLLLPETSEDGAMTCANKIIASLKHLDPPIKVSIGASIVNASDRVGREIMEMADSAMYRAKKAGGSQVVSAS